MPENEKQHPSLKSQSAWLLFAKVAGFGFAFVLPLIVVRILTKEEFGIYRQTFLVIMNAVAILPMGLAMSAYYYLARDEAKRSSAVLNIILVHFAVGLFAFLVLFFFPQILGTVFGNGEIVRLAPLIGTAVWLWLFSVFLEHAAVANREPKTATVFIVFAQLSKTALMTGFVLWFRTVESIIWAAIVQAAIQTIILLVYLARKFPGFWKSFDPKFFVEHIKYAVPFGLAGILWTMQVDLHYYFVSYKFGEIGYAVYAVGCFQLPLVAMLSESVMSVLIPRMSELEAESDKKEMIRVTARAMQKLAFAYFPLYVFLLITSDVFITTLFTNKYAQSVPIFVIFLTLLPFSILISDPIVRAHEELGRFLLKVRIFTFVILVAGLFVGINNFGLEGIIAIVIGIRISEMLFVEFVVFRKIGVRLSDLKLLKNVGKTAIISILAGIATFITYKLVLLDTLAGLIESGVSATGLYTRPLLADFLAGVTVLGFSFAVFLPVYLIGAYLAGTIEDSEKEYVRSFIRNKFSKA